TGAVGLEAVVVEPQRAGDHPGGQVLLHGERPVGHLGGGVGVGPGPAGGGDVTELLLGGAELDHVAPGDEAEHVAGSDEAVGREELVVGAAAADPAPAAGAAGGTASAEAGAGAAVEGPEGQHGGGLP